MEMLGQVHNEIQMLKGRYETSKASSNVSCQTEWPSACNYSATSADNNNDRTIYDIPRPLKEWNASVPDSYVNFDHESKSSNSEQSQLVPISDTQMTHADDMENGAQPPVLPPRRNPYPHSAPACQEHDIANIFRGNTVQLKPRPKSDIQPSRGKNKIFRCLTLFILKMNCIHFIHSALSLLFKTQLLFLFSSKLISFTFY